MNDNLLPIHRELGWEGSTNPRVGSHQIYVQKCTITDHGRLCGVTFRDNYFVSLLLQNAHSTYIYIPVDIYVHVATKVAEFSHLVLLQTHILGGK